MLAPSRTDLNRRLFLGGLVASALVPSASGQDLTAFDYEAQAPLKITDRGGIEKREGAQVRDVSYASPRGGDVPAYLVVPAGKGPFAGIVYLHWGEGDRSEFLAEALLLAQARAASILIDAPFVRPKPDRKNWNDPGGYVQMVVDCRRAVDVLLSLPGVDPKRIAYVGHSLGATWGGVIAAAERRFKALVLMAGLPALSESLRALVPLENLSAEDRKTQEAFLAGVMPFDAVRHIGNAAPAAVFLQFARSDRHITKDHATKYELATSQPKVVRWYDGGHEFTDVRALPDRADFLSEHIGIDPVRPLLRHRLRGRLSAGTGQQSKQR